MRDLPLNGLRVLTTIYEAGGVRPAARAMGISASVVHRHLRELEVRLGATLVEHGRSRVQFTAAGERLAKAGSASLGDLAGAVEAIREDRRANHVLIATTESFASTWLLPRLSAFREQHPTMLVSIRTDQRLSRVPTDADMAIRLATHIQPETATAEPLMDDVMVPVLSPAMANSLIGNDATALLKVPRLHDRDAQTGWRRWGAAFGIDYAELREGARMTSSALVLLAAAEGLGVALGRRRLAEPQLESGQLVALSSLAVPIGTAYWILHRPHARSAEQAVIDWLHREAAAT
jgi:LysR family glycine cleavage system transcriptional activator